MKYWTAIAICIGARRRHLLARGIVIDTWFARPEEVNDA